MNLATMPEIITNPMAFRIQGFAAGLLAYQVTLYIDHFNYSKLPTS